VQNAHVSTARELPLLIVVAGLMTSSVDDFVRWWHCGHCAEAGHQHLTRRAAAAAAPLPEADSRAHADRDPRQQADHDRTDVREPLS
jgi:hypothetical protein